MNSEQKSTITVVSKEAFQAVGLKWEGTFEEAAAGGIRHVQEEMHRRLKEISHIVDSKTLLGLSYDANLGELGFTHYAVVEVKGAENIPAEMVSVTVPSLSYATSEHQKDQNIEYSYQNLYKWIKDQGLKTNNDTHLTHLEKYPLSQDPYTLDPAFTMMIPIV
ncbi:AraC family transcriptional regulator [Salipaludibacillus neizhouensis]|uniref:AraC family transcriptional regulator n=1 Tax=Salipaludibacillus neizhouensis TaxID=885475 RepID=A0A3A9K1N0_9BACI|nr:effector binding domain-containing protein [Salipaludibacillus neizhouensis]RKL66269.1 AraC family transcriptional regulator [Salipaludibacillus neizhouensis]